MSNEMTQEIVFGAGGGFIVPCKSSAPIRAAIQAGLKSMGYRGDANETLLYSRSLETIVAETYQEQYGEKGARSILPVESRIHPLDETLTFRQRKIAGELPKAVRDPGTDYPTVELQGTETSHKQVKYGNSYIYSVDELAKGARSGVNISNEKASAVRELMEMKVDRLAAVGDTDLGLYGLTNTSGINSVSAANAGRWSAKNVDTISADIRKMRAAIRGATMGLHEPTDLVLPFETYNYVDDTDCQLQATGFNGGTILSRIQTGLNLKVSRWHRLDTLDSGEGLIVLFKKDPKVAYLDISQEFTQSAPFFQGMSWRVFCEMRSAGVIVRLPGAVAKMAGVAVVNA